MPDLTIFCFLFDIKACSGEEAMYTFVEKNNQLKFLMRIYEKYGKSYDSNFRNYQERDSIG